MADRQPDIDPSTIVSRETVSVRTRGTSGLEARAKPRTFEIIRTTQRDSYHQDDEADMLEARSARAREAGDRFTGTHRAVAKVRIVRGRPEGFEDLGELLNALPSKATMVRHDPPLTRDEDCDRVEEERMNVRVPAFLWAAIREGDNDYHIIIGRAARKPTRFMNAEVSGLPADDSPSLARLRKARRVFEDLVRDTRTGMPDARGYDFYVPPIPIVIEGSLFFDISHANDAGPGPKDAKPRTIWEIHPVSALEFAGELEEEARAESLEAIDPATIRGTAEMVSPEGMRRTIVRTTQRDGYDEDSD